MIDLYSNENFPIDAVILLRKIGYDVLTAVVAAFQDSRCFSSCIPLSLAFA